MAYIVWPQLISALGDSPEELYQALLQKRSGLSGPLHFQGKGRRLGVCHQIDEHEEFDERYGDARRPMRKPRAFRLLDRLRHKFPSALPKRLYLATTVGAVDLLENPAHPPCETSLALLDYAKMLFDAQEALLVASACSSGQRAVCLAADAVDRGEIPDALVIGCDQLSEFVASGFASLGALTHKLPQPYDASRDGMTLGEAAAAVIVSSKPATGFCARIAAWSETTDAAHITAPDLEGTWLAQAIRNALPGGILPNAIIGHGTGTIYNDQAELAALHRALPGPVPLFSLKGNLGHTIGATGVLQAIIGTKILQEKHFPPQIGLETPAPGAEGYVSLDRRELPADAHWLLSLNAGFGGLNNALLLTDLPDSAPRQHRSCQWQEIACAVDDTLENALSTERDRLVGQGLFTLEDSADFRRAGLAVKHAILAAAKCAQVAGTAWNPNEVTILGHDGDACLFSNPAYWQDYTAHGRNRGRGTLFVDTLSSIPICEAAIALRLHGPAGYLHGLPPELLRHTCHTPLLLEISATQAHAEAKLLKMMMAW